MIYIHHYESPLGKIWLAGDEAGLTELWFAEGSRFTGPSPEGDAIPRETAYFVQTKRWLDTYFSGKDPGFVPQMHLEGSGFRTLVGKIMCTIPFGETVTYGWIADQIAKACGLNKMSPQAVGGAVGHNPISIIVPCHRVVGSNRSLIGYGGGIWRKKALLELEGIDVSRFTIPKKGTAL